MIAGVVVILGWAGPTYAHVEVEADKPQAGATDVTVTFTAESESASAGVVSLTVTLPPGITLSDVAYVSGPAGWSLTPSATGYTVGGPALPVGQDVQYRIRISKLPVDAPSLPFKTLQTYSDGRVDRWIGIQEPGGPAPEMPAPILLVQGAAPAPSPTATTAAPTESPTPPAATTSDGAGATGESTSTTPTVWWVAGVLALVAAIVALSLWLRRRRGVGADSSSHS
jgi:hypothetical protein